MGRVAKDNEMKSIIDHMVFCIFCNWTGTVGDCFSGENGDLKCPKCGKIITINKAEEN